MTEAPRSSLLELQRNFLKVVRSKESSTLIEGHVQNNEILFVAERIKIYQRAYGLRLAHSLRCDCPHLLQALGEDNFLVRAHGFIEAFPPDQWDLYSYTEDFLEFIIKTDQGFVEEALRDGTRLKALCVRDTAHRVGLAEIERGAPYHWQCHPSMVLSPEGLEPFLAFHPFNEAIFKDLNQQEYELLAFLQRARTQEELMVFLEKNQFPLADLQTRLSHWIQENLVLLVSPAI